MKKIWRVAVALALVLALAGVAVVTTGGSATATTPPTFQLPPFPGDAGVLRLHMGGSSDYLRFDPSNGSGGYTAGAAQALVNGSGCGLGAPLPTVMTLTSTPSGGASQGKVGLVSHSLGVDVKGEGNGTPCGQVNGLSQALTLTLAGSLATKSMDAAELDVEGKYGATIRAQLYSDGTLVGTETIATGGPDSGPDSTDGDNFRWQIPSSGAGTVQFDQIKLSVDPSTPTGAFSLEGGSDGTAAAPGPSYGATLGTTDTLFHISNVAGTLGCGSTVTAGGGSTNTPTASITLVNTSDCEAVPYGLSTVNDGDLEAVAFQKIGGDTNVYNATVVWPVEESAYPVPPTMIDYGDGSGPHTLQWCDGTYADPVAPTGEAWCLRKHDAVLSSTGQMQITEELFGRGDPGAWR